MRSGWQRWFFLGLALVAVVSLALDFGFELEGRTRRWLAAVDVTVATLFGLELVLFLAAEGTRAVRQRWHEYLPFFLFLLATGLLAWLGRAEPVRRLAEALGLSSPAELHLVLVQGFVLIASLVHFARGHEYLLETDIAPERIFAGGFALLILLGTALLLLPRASADPGNPVGLLDAFFTSTSAVCVTGLIVRDTGGDFSLFGQLVILFLFQVGGLGIVTFVAFLSLAWGRGFSVPQMVALREITNAVSLHDVRKQVAAIILTAVSIEIVGAFVLYASGAAEGSPPERLYWSVFHAVSAFCNAGFALQPDSLSPWRTDVAVNACVMVLIVIGSLGAPVVRDVANVVASRRPRRFGEERVRLRPSAQTRLTLSVTLAMLLVGFLGFLLCERGGSLAGVPLGERAMVSAFQSVTTRTAGFNTVPIDAVSEATLLVLVLCMVIGASPVSTGGGVKTTAFGILLLELRAMVTGRHVEAFGRAVPGRIVQAATSVFVLYSITAIAVTFLLSLSDPGCAFEDRLFEAVSALSTVGLTRGITPDLSSFGQLLLCVAMFVGRVGPLTLVMTVVRTERAATYRYPVEQMVLS